ncbi:MAG: hypothetical protein J0I20_24705 [Chloroflexi bacterium]|nr:hypothetical protein [Chloroflexota bacterium]OJV99775.1 MAG: hypothetical protein BGO39_12585 [Chloroflexi bacterium 54-19]
MSKKEQPNRWKGYLTGVIGGVAGTIAMGYFWQAAKILNGDKDPRQETIENPGEFTDISLAGKHHEDDESSTMAMGRIAYTFVTAKPPDSDALKSLLSNIVHYSYGAKQGANYGAIRAGTGAFDIEGGLAWGTGLWLLGDELSVSALGLAEGPGKYPLKQHLYRWGAHLTYGLVTSLVARLFYKIF